MPHRDEHPHDENPRHWLQWWPGISFGNIATMIAGIAFALTLFFTFGQAFADNAQTDKRQDVDIERVTKDVADLKAAGDKRAEKLDSKLEEMNRNIVALMVAQGVKPAGGER